MWQLVEALQALIQNPLDSAQSEEEEKYRFLHFSLQCGLLVLYTSNYFLSHFFSTCLLMPRPPHYSDINHCHSIYFFWKGTSCHFCHRSVPWEADSEVEVRQCSCDTGLWMKVRQAEEEDELQDSPNKGPQGDMRPWNQDDPLEFS